MKIENRINRHIRRRRDSVQAFGLMREMTKELPPGTLSAKRPGGERTQARPARSPSRQSYAFELGPYGQLGGSTLSKAHVSRVSRTLDRRPHDLDSRKAQGAKGGLSGCKELAAWKC